MGRRKTASELAPSNLFPPAGSYFLTFPEFAQIAPLTGDQVFSTGTSGEHVMFEL